MSPFFVAFFSARIFVSSIKSREQHPVEILFMLQYNDSYSVNFLELVPEHSIIYLQMALGFINVGPQGGGGQRKRKTPRGPRRMSVRKPLPGRVERSLYLPPPSPYANADYSPGPASPYAEYYTQNEYSRTHDNAPVTAHYQLIYPEPPLVRERVKLIAPGGREEHREHQRYPRAASYRQDNRRSQDIARGQPPQQPTRRREEPRRRSPNPPKKKIAPYYEIKVLGVGGQGECHLVERRSDGKRFVRKVSHTYSKTSRGQPLEARILQEILGHHKRSIKLIEYAIVEDYLITIYDFYPGGDLLSCLPYRNQKQSESFVWWIFLQLADVLAYLHEGFDYKDPYSAPRDWQPVIHCDIKPENVFLREHPRDNPYPNVVLGDFGFATLHSGKNVKGTSPYFSPELEETGNTKASDIWALGATIHELVHGYVPQDIHPDPLPKSFSSNLDKIVRTCLTKNPSYRTSARELVQKINKEYDRRP